MTKRTLRNVISAVVIILIVCALGALTSGFTKFGISDIKDKFEKKRNPDNLILLDNVSLKDKKSATSDVEYTVDKLGAVTLKGKATADEEITYGSVTLEPGTYTLTGAENGKNDTYTLGLMVGVQFMRSDSGTIVITTKGTYSVVIRVFKGANFLSTKITPALVSGDEAIDFYK